MEIKPNFSKYPGEKNTQFKVSFGTLDGSQIMECPICSFEFTHIEQVSTYSREDDETIHLETNIDLRDKKVVTNVVNGFGNNPSARRNGLILHGYCESEQGCRFDIEIYQHKGNTFVNSFFKGNRKENNETII